MMRIHSQSRQKYPELPEECPDAYLPIWAESRANKNHGQTLKGLNERGGLDPVELIAIMRNIGVFDNSLPTEEKAAGIVCQLIDAKGDCGYICEYVEPYGFVPECGCPVHDGNEDN